MNIWPRVYSIASRAHPMAPVLSARVMLIAKERYGEPELHYVRQLANPSKLSLDIGANWGMYTGVMVRSSASVIAFEPNPSVAARLSRSFPGVRVEKCALGETNGGAMLNVPRSNGAQISGLGSLVSDFVDADKIEVPVRRLDDFEFRNVGFIKIDVEGFELSVLAGARATIERERPNMLIEAEGTEAAHALHETVTRMGYAMTFVLAGREHPFSDWDAGLRSWNGRPPINFLLRPTTQLSSTHSLD